MSVDRVNTDWLYLFSSNQSPRYAQDVANVLAYPEGAHYTFRYDLKYVEPETKEAWRSLKPHDGKAGARVLVLFSMQQAARFQDPAYLPVRLGEVVETDIVGTRHFVTFRVEDPVVLRFDEEQRKNGRLHEAVKAFTQQVETSVQNTPNKEYSASLGPALAPGRSEPGGLEIPEDPDVAFERAVEFFGRTESFRGFSFFRVRRVTGTHSDTPAPIDSAGVLELKAGVSYDLQLVHSQIASPTSPRRFAVDTDGSILGVIGHAGFDVASRYDRPVVALHASAPPQPLQVRQTVMDIHPGPQVHGPEVSIVVRVMPDKGRAVGIASGQATALFAVGLAGVLAQVSAIAGAALALAGAGVAAALQLFGTSPLRASSLPSGSKSDGAAPPADGGPPAAPQNPPAPLPSSSEGGPHAYV